MSFKQFGVEGDGSKEVIWNNSDVSDELKDTDLTFICNILSFDFEKSIPNHDFHSVSPITTEILTVI